MLHRFWTDVTMEFGYLGSNMSLEDQNLAKVFFLKMKYFNQLLVKIDKRADYEEAVSQIFNVHQGIENDKCLK